MEVLLAPDIRERMLVLPRTTKGHNPISEEDVRPIAVVDDWRRQRRMWARIAGVERGVVSVRNFF